MLLLLLLLMFSYLTEHHTTSEIRSLHSGILAAEISKIKHQRMSRGQNVHFISVVSLNYTLVWVESLFHFTEHKIKHYALVTVCALLKKNSSILLKMSKTSTACITMFIFGRQSRKTV